MDWSYIVAGCLPLVAVMLGSWLRGGAAEQAERRHEAERTLDALRLKGLDAQLRDAAERIAAAERLDAERVAELASLRRAMGAGGGPPADGLLLELGPSAGRATAIGAPVPAGGLPA